MVSGQHVTDFLDESNPLRPHEAIGWQRAIGKLTPVEFEAVIGNTPPHP